MHPFYGQPGGSDSDTLWFFLFPNYEAINVADFSSYRPNNASTSGPGG